MSSLPIKNMSGAEVGQHDLSDDLLEYEKGLQTMQQAVVTYLANQRQGSAHTLTKGEVRGSNKKLWKQKGTGRARMGIRRSPIWRGGGVVFGPKPRDYSKKMNRRQHRLAFKRAFSEKVAAGQVVLIEGLGIDEPKTRLMAAFAQDQGVTRKALLLTAEADTNVQLACRNLVSLDTELAANANTYQLLRYELILCAVEAMETLEARLGS